MSIIIERMLENPQTAFKWLLFILMAYPLAMEKSTSKVMQEKGTRTLHSAGRCNIDNVRVNHMCRTHAKAFSNFISNHPVWMGKTAYQLEYPV